MIKIYKYNEHKKLNINIEFDNFLKLIDRDCQEFIKLLREIKDIKTYVSPKRLLFYRGMKKGDKEFIKDKVRKNRKQLDSDYYFNQQQLDDIFYKELGVRPRSEGLFATTSQHYSRNYGDIYVIFPIGKFNYVTTDFFTDSIDFFIYYFEVMNGDEGIEIKNEYIEKYGKSVNGNVPYKYLEYFVSHYKLNDSDLVITIREGNEIIFLCDEYYAVKVDSSTEYLDKIIKWLDEKN